MTATLVSELASMPGIAMLVLSFALLLLRDPATLIAAASCQAGLLALAALLQAGLQSSFMLVLLAAITAGAKVFALPVAMRQLSLPRPRDGARSGAAAAGLGMAALALGVAGPGAGVALAIVLLGALALATRRDALGRIGAVAGLENGVMLAAVSAPGLAGAPLLALATLALPGAVVFAYWRRSSNAGGPA